MARRATRVAQQPPSVLPRFSFADSLVLFQYMLSLFGKASLNELCEGMKADDFEGLDEHNVSFFCRYLSGLAAAFPGITKEDLLRYDQNIVSHTRSISVKRPGFRWKYFQYMALLFTEIYLDKYFHGRKRLLEDLNVFIGAFNVGKHSDDQLEQCSEEDLNKIAFWQATGSGKTLIMHVNIFQYRYYLHKTGRIHDLNRVILLTPNEGLSTQHREELEVSSMKAGLFVKEVSSTYLKNDVDIIDIHKLISADEDGKIGEKRIAAVAFESNNLVLVDEGHKGASSGEIGPFLKRRDELCQDGFSFEYSATFGQAVTSDKKLQQQYSKCILFDYSYKYFYGDGYGKEYSILNLAEDHFDDQKQMYLTACLLSFYQQLKVYVSKKSELIPFNIETPLLVFVGSKVTAVRTENRVAVSDVVDILLFLRQFLVNPQSSIAFIDRLLNGTFQLNDTNGKDLFAGKFQFLTATGMTPEAIFDDIRASVFNNSAPDAQIHVDNLKGVEGEIGLRLGTGEYFGVINVGDDAKLAELCEEAGFPKQDQIFSDSLFRQIGSVDSPVKLLIGSKKFSEGWNSWRVSTMGLMNVGKSEGAEIIQLFGRGVRLKGYAYSLKRSKYSGAPSKPDHIEVVETLSIFGVRSNYMTAFKESLEREGVKGKDDIEEISLPCIKNLGAVRLKYPHLKPNVNFKKNAPRPALGEPTEYLRSRRVQVNWYPRIEAMQSAGAAATREAALQTGVLGDEQCAFLDYDRIYFELQRYKSEKGYHNLAIEKSILSVLLGRHDWYELLIPPEELMFSSFEKVRMWQEIATVLLKKYCDNFYNASRMNYEKDKFEYRYLDEVEQELLNRKAAGNLFNEYIFSVEKSKTDIIAKIKELKELIDKKVFAEFSFKGLMSFDFQRHLYKPLVHIKKDWREELKVMPVALNEGEKEFVEHLKKFYEGNKDFFQTRELYLLRNLGRGHGVGFFQANNFYPDFILWIVDGINQHIAFVDPKGLRMIDDGFCNPKIRFYREIKDIERQIGDVSVTLDSFIVSVTSHVNTGWAGNPTETDFEAHQVLFQDKAGKYIEKIIDKITGSSPTLTYDALMASMEIVPDPGSDARFATHLPYYSLEAACGQFGEQQAEIDESSLAEWVAVDRKKLGKDMFVVKAVGRSMEPEIKDGNLCVFKADPAGPFSGRIFLFKHRLKEDPETGATYSIKRYVSHKGPDGRNVKIELQPLNNEFEPIVFEGPDENIGDRLIIVGEFIDVLKKPTT